MNRIFFPSIVSAVSLMCLAITCHAQGFASPRFAGAVTRCDQVIQMMLRYGVNNSYDRSNTISLLGQSSPFGFPGQVNEMGDLQIVQVEQFASETTPTGPKFTVVVLNQSNRQVNNFHVTVVAVFGSIHPFSPSQTVAVEKIDAGEALQVVVSLPIDVNSMGKRNGQLLGFEQLVIAIDSFDQLLETDEANNIKAYSASEIGVAVPIADLAVSSVIESSAIALLSQQVDTQVQGGISQTQSNYVSVDELDLEQPTSESLRSAIQQFSSPAPGTSSEGGPSNVQGNGSSSVPYGNQNPTPNGSMNGTPNGAPNGTPNGVQNGFQNGVQGNSPNAAPGNAPNAAPGNGFAPQQNAPAQNAFQQNAPVQNAPSQNAPSQSFAPSAQVPASSH